MDFHYRNGHFDELLYVQSGSGYIRTNFGNINFKFGIFITLFKNQSWVSSIKDCIFFRWVKVSFRIVIDSLSEYSSNNLFDSSIDDSK